MASGGMLVGPESGYPVMFEAHGKERVFPDDTLQVVADRLQVLINEIRQLKTISQTSGNYTEDLADNFESVIKGANSLHTTS
jgi:hypothetical protein